MTTGDMISKLQNKKQNFYFKVLEKRIRFKVSAKKLETKKYKAERKPNL